MIYKWLNDHQAIKEMKYKPIIQSKSSQIRVQIHPVFHSDVCGFKIKIQLDANIQSDDAPDGINLTRVN